MIKQIVAIFMIAMMVMPTAIADEDEYDPGWITPDSFLWELDLRIERLWEKFAINDAHRTALLIKHMNERLGEMQTGEKYDKVSTRYMEQIAKVENNTVRYESVERVRNTFLDHQAVLMNMTVEQFGNFTALREEVRNRIEAGAVEMEEAGDDIIEDELTWFANKSAEFGITSISTPIDNNFYKYAQHLKDGTTLVDIVGSDGEIVQSYTIDKTSIELPGVVDEPITIQTGSVTDYVEKYTITIEQLQKYDKMI